MMHSPRPFGFHNSPFRSILIAARLYLPLVVLPLALRAHEGHDHGPKLGDEATATGPVTLTPQARANLGIEVFEAAIGPIRKTVALLARIEAIPEKTARLSARVDGHVAEIYVRLGQAVEKGDPLLKLEPLTIDTPPVVLKAPFRGVVTAQHTAIGMPLTAETVLVELADLREVLARGVAYENADLSNVRTGTPATVQLDFFRGETFSGHVERIAPTLDIETRTFDLYARLPNADLRLKPGLQGTLRIGVGEESVGVSVPARAVLGSLGNLFVFVETPENTFERRPITVGLTLGDRIEILEGVLPGDKVVTRGNYQLQFAAGAKPRGQSEASPDAHTHADGTAHKH